MPLGVQLIYPEDVTEREYMQTVKRKFEKAKLWSRARIKWLEFVEPYLHELRRDTHDPSIRYVEVRGTFVSKYFAKHKFYAIETNRVSRPKLFALSLAGRIVDLNSGQWSSKEGHVFRNEAFSSFFQTKKNSGCRRQ